MIQWLNDKMIKFAYGNLPILKERNLKLFALIKC